MKKGRINRRRFLMGVAGGSAGTLALGGTLSRYGERNWPRTFRVTITRPELPAALDGFRICQISDLHRGPLVDAALIRRGDHLANAHRPDLTVVTRDFVSDTSRYAESCAAALADLRAPHGVYGVLGNHDYWTLDVEGVAA